MNINKIWIFGCLVVVGLVCACDSDDTQYSGADTTTSNGTSCAADASQACVCADGQEGMSICENGAYSACDCQQNEAVCTPGESRCVGAGVEICLWTGEGWESRECDADQSCVDGECREAESCPDLFAGNTNQDNAAELLPGLYPDLVVCESGSDFFRFAADPLVYPDGAVMDVELSWDALEGDLSLFVFNDTERASSENAQMLRFEDVSFALDAGEEVWIEVQHQGGAPVEYALLLAARPNVDACQDRFEPNDTVDTATDIGDGTYDDLTLCASAENPDFEDWYRLSAEDAVTHVTIAYEPAFVPFAVEDDSGQLWLGEDGVIQFIIEGSSTLRLNLRDPEPEMVVDVRYNMTLEAAEPRPDLAVEMFEVSPTTIYEELGWLSFSAEISNIGFADASPTRFALYIQREGAVFDPDTAVQIYTSTPFALDRGERFTIPPMQVFLDDPIVADGNTQVHLFARVDPDDEVEESNTSNNNASAIINVVEEGAEGMDIALLEASIEPSVTALGASTEIRLVLANSGTEEVRSFFCSVFFAESPTFVEDEAMLVTNVNLTRLEAFSERVEVTQSFVIPEFFEIGEFYVHVICDPSNSVREIYENNNHIVLGETVIIEPAAEIDLDLVALEISGSLVDGGSANITATVANRGTFSSPPTQLLVALSDMPMFALSNPTLVEVEIPSIFAGESIEVDVDGMVSCTLFQPSYFLTAQIDPLNRIPEVDESNNAYASSAPLMLTGERCVCVADMFDASEEPAEIEPGTYTLTLCEGDEDVYTVVLERGQTLNVTVTPTIGDSSLDVRVLTADLQEVEPLPNGTWSQLSPLGGIYSIEISGAVAGALYTLVVEVVEPEMGVDLFANSVDVNTEMAQAGGIIEVEFSASNLGGSDLNGFDASLFLSTTPDMMPLGSLGRVMVDGLPGASLRSSTNLVTLPTDLSGTYYMCVELDPDDVVDELNETNNSVCGEEPITIGLVCDDILEPNSDDSPAELEPGTYGGLQVCRDMPDYYRFCVDDSTQFTVTASFEHSEGDIDLILFDENGDGLREIAISSGVINMESVGQEFVNGNTCYVVMVFFSDPIMSDIDGGNRYQLEFVAEDADPELSCDDSTESNDTPDMAIASNADLFDVVNDTMELDRCPIGDIDFFFADLQSDSEYTLCLVNLSEGEDRPFFSVTLYDPDRQQLDARVDTEPCVNVQTTAAGRYFVRVLSSNRTRRSVPYTMTVTGEFGRDLSGRDLVVNPSSLTPGVSLLTYSFVVENVRVDTSYAVYYSTDAIIDPDVDLLLDLSSVEVDPETDNQMVNSAFSIPDDPSIVVGDGYIGVYIDPENVVEESDENNNSFSTMVLISEP